jgi:hypothetical protein
MAIANRGSLSLPGIFGSSASTTIPTPPTPGNSYRDTSLSDGDMAEAWPYAEIVLSEKFNQVMFLITSLLKQLEQQGILSWSSSVDYPAGAICFGSDAQVYTATQASVHTSPQNPTTATTYWRLFSSGLLGASSNKEVNTVYQAATDGFVLAYGIAYGSGDDNRIDGFSDANNPPTTKIAEVNSNSGNWDIGTLPMIVKKGDYWKVSTVSTGITIRWIPLGT